MHILHAIKKACQFGPRNALHMQLNNRLVFINRDRSLSTVTSAYFEQAVRVAACALSARSVVVLTVYVLL